jgi:acyl-CoA-dependent ceramide synthase
MSPVSASKKAYQQHYPYYGTINPSFLVTQDKMATTTAATTPTTTTTTTKYTKKYIKHVVEVYHPYVACAIVVVLLLGRTIIPGVDKFFTIASQTTRNNQIHYSRGYDDVYVIAFLVCVITLIRFLYRVVVLEPIARQLKMSKGLTAKFIEAGWCGLYFLVVTTWGCIIFADEPWWFNARYLWDGYPHALNLDLKIFMVAALAFWLQSLLSFSFEPPRKDDVAMTFHHCLTVYLIVCCYLTGFERVGAAILMQQNVGDIIYYHAKVFRYAKLPKLADAAWITFLFVWIYSRHIIFGVILYSFWHSNQYIPYIWDPELDIYFSKTAFYAYFASLSALQLLMCFWLVMIIKVAYKALLGGSAELKDSTEYSDDEVEEQSVSYKAEAITTKSKTA